MIEASRQVQATVRGALASTRFLRWADQTRIALVAAVLSALASSLLATFIDDGDGVRDQTLRDLQRPGYLFEALIGGLLFAPVVETALMGWLITLLRERGVRRGIVLCVSAAFWAAAHVALSGQSAWLIAIPFFAFGFVYLKRNEGIHHDGYTVAFVAHFYYNVGAMVGLMATIGKG